MEKKYKDYHYLHEHPGTEKHEVIEIIKKEDEVYYLEVDSISEKLIVKSSYEPADKKKHKTSAWKLDFYGNHKDNTRIHTILNDGTMWDWEYYTNWIVNGDTLQYRYIEPLEEGTPEFEDKEEWLKTFKDLHARASYIYIYIGRYYFKIEGKWYMLKPNYDAMWDGFRKRYPKEEDREVRMVELKDIMPNIWIPPADRDTSLLKELDYEVKDFEKGTGLNPINYSEGDYYMEVYMPGGDTIRFKRYGCMGHQMKLYKIPEEYGGREDILFVVQTPRGPFSEQLGGMYVIRPRELPPLPEPEPREVEIKPRKEREVKESLVFVRENDTSEKKRYEKKKQAEKEKRKAKRSVYKTYKGKDYTREEWEAFVEEGVKEYKKDMRRKRRGFWG